jgi:hypothetical protein
MNVTRHSTVLQALTHHAQQFHQRLNVMPKDPQHSWTLDETGTLETLRLLLSSEIEIEQQEISELNCIQVPEEILYVHGYAPPKKAEGTIGLIYENVNGFCNRLSGNEKVNRAKEIHDDLEVDIVAYWEHKLNMKHKKMATGLTDFLGEGRPRSSPLWHTMSMEILEGFNKGVQVSSSLVT